MACMSIVGRAFAIHVQGKGKNTKGIMEKSIWRYHPYYKLRLRSITYFIKHSSIDFNIKRRYMKCKPPI